MASFKHIHLRNFSNMANKFYQYAVQQTCPYRVYALWHWTENFDKFLQSFSTGGRFLFYHSLTNPPHNVFMFLRLWLTEKSRKKMSRNKNLGREKKNFFVLTRFILGLKYFEVRNIFYYYRDGIFCVKFFANKSFSLRPLTFFSSIEF